VVAPVAGPGRFFRPRNAGSSTAADHIAVLDDALVQLPVDPNVVEVIAVTDIIVRAGGGAGVHAGTCQGGMVSPTSCRQEQQLRAR
jgi:hypothetical protein